MTRICSQFYNRLMESQGQLDLRHCKKNLFIISTSQSELFSCKHKKSESIKAEWNGQSSFFFPLQWAKLAFHSCMNKNQNWNTSQERVWGDDGRNGRSHREEEFQFTAEEETKNIIKSTAANGIQNSINIYLSEHLWASLFFAFED